MTTPVTATAEGDKIAMTAPVTSTGPTDGLYRVRFSMPNEWTMQTLPKPTNPDVELVEIDARTRAGRHLSRPRTMSNGWPQQPSDYWTTRPSVT